MDLKPHERAQNVVRYLAKKRGCTQAEIGQEVGRNNRQAFSAVLNGKVRMPAKMAQRLAALDPEINPQYLTGESDVMLKGGASDPPLRNEPEARPGVYIPPELIQMITDMSASLRSQQETLRSQQETIREQLSIIRQGLAGKLKGEKAG